MSKADFDKYKPEFHKTDNAYMLPNEYDVSLHLAVSNINTFAQAQLNSNAWRTRLLLGRH